MSHQFCTWPAPSPPLRSFCFANAVDVWAFSLSPLGFIITPGAPGIRCLWCLYVRGPGDHVTWDQVKAAHYSSWPLRRCWLIGWGVSQTDRDGDGQQAMHTYTCTHTAVCYKCKTKNLHLIHVHLRHSNARVPFCLWRFITFASGLWFRPV